jgi:Lar family restriction alleviation protein
MKNCPFCGGNIDEDTFVVGNGGVFVKCNTCGAKGPPEETSTEAVESWNKRAK